jgi:hypothetical protein
VTLYIFIVCGTTKTQVNHDNKIAVVHWRNPECAMITLACSQGQLFGATRSYELPEATLDPKEPQQIITQYWPEEPTKISHLD